MKLLIISILMFSSLVFAESEAMLALDLATKSFYVGCLEGSAEKGKKYSEKEMKVLEKKCDDLTKVYVLKIMESHP